MPEAPDAYIGKNVVRAHIDKALSEIIQPNEFLHGAFHGRAFSSDPGKRKGGLAMHDYLLVTDQRVVFWTRGMFSGSTDGFHYDDIARVEEARGLIFGEIVLNIRGAKERLKEMVKDDVPKAAQMIRERVLAANEPALNLSPESQSLWYYADAANEPVGPLPMDVLQRLAGVGVISPETHVLEKGGTEWKKFASIVPPPARAETNPAPAEVALSSAVVPAKENAADGIKHYEKNAKEFFRNCGRRLKAFAEATPDKCKHYRKKILEFLDNCQRGLEAQANKRANATATVQDQRKASGANRIFAAGGGCIGVALGILLLIIGVMSCFTLVGAIIGIPIIVCALGLMGISVNGMAWGANPYLL